MSDTNAGTRSFFIVTTWDKHGDYQSLYSTYDLAAEAALESAKETMRGHGDDEGVEFLEAAEGTTGTKLIEASTSMSNYEAGVSVVEIALEA